MGDQKIFEKINHVEPIQKGWSEDKKFCAVTADGTKYLLRISHSSKYEKREDLFKRMRQVAELGIPMCEPVEFGSCDGGVYSIHKWIDGENLITVLPLFSETEQYRLGYISGELVKKMHTIPAPEGQEEWELRFNRKTDIKIKKYNECGLRFDGDHHILDYINRNRHLLKNRP